MTAERESMTLQEMDAPALGVEERRDEAPRAGASHARPTPDPEVVAKPKRRKFTAQYRLRILEEAESCTQPGEVGRLLRREGLYSSHLTEWRRARREGSLQGLTPSKTRSEARRAQPPQREGARARGESGLAGEGAAHRPYDPGRPGKSCRAAGIQPRTREGLLMAVQPLASQVGVAPACRALGVPRASSYRRRRPASLHLVDGVRGPVLVATGKLVTVTAACSFYRLSLLLIASALPTTARFSGTDIKLI